MHTLNHIYRTIWSEALGAWIAVSEITKAKGKRSGSSLLRVLCIGGIEKETDDTHRHRIKPLAFALACCFALNVQANPLGGDVVNGSATFNNSGNTLTVTNTPGTIINWQSFSIGASETTRFVQQSAASTVLNRVVTNNPSAILGTLSSNGQVYLVNANGIMFGAGATVDVAGLVATSLNLSDNDFKAGRHNYTAVSGAQNVSNSGNINAQQGGQIYLIAPNVENNGVITAPNGEVLLAAGHSVELVSSNDPNLRVQITAPAGDATNLGQLIVESGSLGLFGTVVRNTGIVSANSATMEGGRIVFRSTQRTEVSGTVSASGMGGGEIHVLSDMQDGTVNVSGTLDASAPVGGDGGFVDTSAAHVRIEDGARISTLAANGVNGNWLIDPTDYYVSAVDPANGSSWMSNTTLSTNLGLGNVIIQTLASGAGNGDIFINDAVSWAGATNLTLNAHRNVEINAAITGDNSGLGAPGSVTVHADINGTGVGTIVFGVGGAVSVVGGTLFATPGQVSFYYNPTVFGTPNNYSANVPVGNLTELMLVNNVTNLQNINGNLAGNYALGRDINAAGGFTPLGIFTGIFDGQNHTISNLTITGAGMFSTIGAGGVVANVGLINSNVSASSSGVGALAGSNAGTISNCYVSNGTVTVTGAFWGVGGLVGSNSGAIIDSHVSGGSVNGQYGHIGGLAGENAGTIDTSYVENVNVVNAASFATSAGGLVGNNTGTISNTYVNGGSVVNSASSSTGGPVGGLVGYNSGIINTSYASNGSLSSTGLIVNGPIGGLIGNHAAGSINNSFWDIDTTGQAGGIGINIGGTGTPIGIHSITGTIDAYSQATYVGFDFTNAWWMSDTNTRPFLRSEWSTTITNAHELQLMELDAAAAYKQANNIDMTLALAAGGMWSSAGFKPVGDNMLPPYYFTGVYDGAGYMISGLVINRPTVTYVGLFGMTNGASISNVWLENASVTGLDYVGGLVGYGSISTTIDNGYIGNSAIAGRNNVGGLMGYGSSSTVSNSHVLGGTVTGTWGVGGLAGSSYNTNYTGDYANSAVSGATNVGGLIGQLDFLGSLSNSYVNGGSVTGTVAAGGLVGSMSSVGSITNSHYNINAVIINGGNAVTFGGLYNDSTANFYGVGQFTDWLSHGMTLDIANYTTASGGSLGTSGANSYTVGTAQGIKDMLGFADNAAYTFALTSNITLSNGVYVPYLAASFNGAGFTVSSLNLNQGYASRLGLFGHVAAGATVSNVFLSNASVTGADEVGALVGLNEGTISGSHSIGGAVSGGSSVGGLVGHSLQGDIQNSYVSGGTVNGTSFVGGLVGRNTGAATNLGAISAGFITSSYVNGGIVVTGTGNSVGGLVGQSRSARIVGSHATLADNAGDSVIGINNVGGLVGMNGGSMDTRSSIITNSWVDVVTSGTVSGTNNVGGLVGYDSGEGVLTNNTVTGATVNGDNWVGGLAGIMASAPFINAGYASNNDVVNSFVNGGAVIGVGSTHGMYIGGLAGLNGKALTNSYVSGGTVSGNTAVGGLAGRNNGSIGTSFVIGSSIAGGATGSASMGGLVGGNYGAIQNTYVSGGSVSGASNVGGLVGNNGFGGTIGFSYVDAGSVTSTGGYVGGVVGQSSTAGSIADTYWNTALVGGFLTNGIGYDVGPLGATDVGAVGLTTAQMQQMSSFIGWDIANTGAAGTTWRIYDGQTGPLLTSFLTPLTVTANSGSRIYDGTTGGLGVTYSVVPNTNLLGTVVAQTSSPEVGTYTVMPSGLYSTALGYDISYASGTVDILEVPPITPPILSELVLSILVANQSQQEDQKNDEKKDEGGGAVFEESGSIGAGQGGRLPVCQ